MPAPPPPAATDRTGRVDDLPEVQRLWATTFPHLPAPDLTAALAEGRVLVQVADEGAVGTDVPDIPSPHSTCGC